MDPGGSRVHQGARAHMKYSDFNFTSGSGHSLLRAFGPPCHVALEIVEETAESGFQNGEKAFDFHCLAVGIGVRFLTHLKVVDH